MHFGFQGWRQRIDTFYSGNNGDAGTFTFDGRYTAGPDPLATSGSGKRLRRSGLPAGLALQYRRRASMAEPGDSAPISSRRSCQDDWHILHNLTINVGLRWELHTPWVEVDNRQSNFGLISGAIEIAGQNWQQPGLYNQYNGITNFQPRVGFAWNPFGRTRWFAPPTRCRPIWKAPAPTFACPSILRSRTSRTPTILR